jgi:hypothetical protein
MYRKNTMTNDKLVPQLKEAHVTLAKQAEPIAEIT